MRYVLLRLIQAYTWVSGIGDRRRIRKKMERLRKADPYNYSIY